MVRIARQCFTVFSFRISSRSLLYVCHTDGKGESVI